MLSYTLFCHCIRSVLRVAVPINYGMLAYRKTYHEVSCALVAVPVNSEMLFYFFTSKTNFMKRKSQSPSIMECSPTQTYTWPLAASTRRSPRQFWNALLLPPSPRLGQERNRRSPRQLWNAFLLMLPTTRACTTCRSPHQFWNALLPPSKSHKNEQRLSQSPSIMECSPTC